LYSGKALSYISGKLIRFMKLQFFLSILLSITIAESLNAQLVSWRDLIDGDLPQPTERIQYGPDSLQFGDLWLPDDEPHTTVILIHGGCWLSAYPGVEMMHHMAETLRDEGFAVWNLEYRRLGHDGGGYPGTFLDASDGADFLRTIAPDYGLNLDRLIVTGHSAGGHLATWLAARKSIDAVSPLYSPNPIDIHTVISLAGINDLERYANYGSSSCGENTVERLVNLEERGENAFIDTSPVNLLPLDVPFIDIVAAFDAPVPPFFGNHFVNAAREAGDDATIVLQPKAGHFEMITPWSDEWEEVLELFHNILD
jgi:acetyl esterase/lipase